MKISEISTLSFGRKYTFDENKKNASKVVVEDDRKIELCSSKASKASKANFLPYADKLSKDDSARFLVTMASAGARVAKNSGSALAQSSISVMDNAKKHYEEVSKLIRQGSSEDIYLNKKIVVENGKFSEYQDERLIRYAEFDGNCNYPVIDFIDIAPNTDTDGDIAQFRNRFTYSPNGVSAYYVGFLESKKGAISSDIEYNFSTGRENKTLGVIRTDSIQSRDFSSATETFMFAGGRLLQYISNASWERGVDNDVNYSFSYEFDSNGFKYKRPDLNQEVIVEGDKVICQEIKNS